MTKQTITLGCDPEFTVVTDNGKQIDANTFIEGDGLSMNTDFGHDGHSATAELRTKPAKSPKEAVKYLKEILEKNKSKYPQAYKHNLKATSNRLSLGGHIHFGHPKLRGKDRELLARKISNNLDNLLAFPCMYLENKEDAKTRKGSFGYGRFSDFRFQTHGFEYRTLPSFLASKELASAVFYTAHAIAQDTLDNDLIIKPFAEKDEFSNAFQHHALDLLCPHLKKAYKELKRLTYYKEKKEYKKEIDKFINMVKKSEQAFDIEMKTGWHIDFDIMDYWKVEKIENLLDKITKTLIKIHQGKELKQAKVKFVYGSIKDYGCNKISRNVNLALNKLIDKFVLENVKVNPIKIVGLKEKRGNEIWVGNYIQGLRQEKKRKQLLGYLWSLAVEFEHTTKIKNISFTTNPVGSNSIAIGRKAREENPLMLEAMIVITILLAHRELFQSEEKKRGKKKALRVTKAKVVSPIVKELKKVKNFKEELPLVELPEKLPNIILPHFFDLNLTGEQLELNIKNIEYAEKIEAMKMVEPIMPFLEKIAQNSCCMPLHNYRELYQKPIPGGTVFVEEEENKQQKKERKELEKLFKKICNTSIEPLKLACPHHIASRLTSIIRIYLIKVSNCENCGNDTEEADFCDNCGNCVSCCNCYYCSRCERRCFGDDFCFNCDSCVSDCEC